VDGHPGETFPPAPEVHRLYDAEAVDRYVAALHEQLASLQAQVDEATRLAHEAEQKMEEAEAAQALLGRVWLSAQADIDLKLAEAERQARHTVADAQRQADELLAETRLQAQAIINEAHETIQAVFAALTRRNESGPASRQPVIDLTASASTTPPAPAPVPTAGPWTPTQDLSTEPQPTVSTGDVGAQIVELSRIERRLHTLAGRPASPVPERSDPASRATSPPGPPEWPTYDPTGTDGGAVAWAESEAVPGTNGSVDHAPLTPPDAPEEAASKIGEAPPCPPEAAASPGTTEASYPAPKTPDIAPASVEPGRVHGQPPPPVPRSQATTRWSALPATAGWSPDAPDLRRVTHWSASEPAATAPPEWAPPVTSVEATTPAERIATSGALTGGPERSTAQEPAVASAATAFEIPPVAMPAEDGAPRPPATVSSWRERWRLARDGASALDDDMLSRADHLASLEDGTYVGELRDGLDLPPSSPPNDDARALEFLPPPAGPPVILDDTIGRAVEQATSRRLFKRAGA